MLSVPGGSTMRNRSIIPCSACRKPADPATAPSTTRIMGENARNMLKATACDNVMQLGTTRITARQKRRKNGEIISGFNVSPVSYVARIAYFYSFGQTYLAGFHQPILMTESISVRD